MDSFKGKRYKYGPERIIQDAIIKMLRGYGWYVMETHGNMYQRGFPDLYTTHSQYRMRWVEIKNPDKYQFTPAQLECFPKMSANGSPIWVLTAPTKFEYDKLFGPENWYQYLEIWKRGPTAK